MKQSINIEAEGSELVLKNKAGDYVIIPKKYRTEVQGMIKDACHGCVDSLVDTLPVMEDYAQDGTVFPKSEPITLIKPSGERVNTTTDSDFYRMHYNFKLIGKQNEDKSWNLTDDIYKGSDLPEVTVTSKIQPNTFADYSNQFSKQNPQEKFFADKQAAHNKEFYSAPQWAQQAVGGYDDKRKANDRKRDEEEYNQQRNNFIAEKLLKRTPFEGMDNRVNWMNKFTPHELETIKKSKYSSELEEGALQKFENFILGMNTSGNNFKSKGTTDKEAKVDQANPLNLLQPLTIPTKAVQSVYKNNYSFSDAMKGKANNASIVEDIVTDPLNLVGLGIWSKLSKANKFRSLDEAYQSIKGLSKEEQLSKLEKAMNNSDKFVTQEDKVNRMLAKKELIKDATKNENKLSLEEQFNPFKVEETQLSNGEKDLIDLSKGKYNSGMTYESFENAAKTWSSKRNDELAGTMDNLGRASHNNYWGISTDFKGLPEDADVIRKMAYEKFYKNATPEQKLIIENHIKNHELDHFLYKQSRKEYDDLIRTFNPEDFGLSKKYLIGKKSTIAGDELRARMGQLMDYFKFKYNPNTNQVEDLLGNTKFTKEHLEYAINNYIKDTKLDNSMSDFFKGISNKNLFIKNMNNRALGIIPFYLYLQNQQNNKEKFGN